MTQLTPEQWNGLVALMRAIGVAAARPGDYEANRQAGACESNVRKMFVEDDGYQVIDDWWANPERKGHDS